MKKYFLLGVIVLFAFFCKINLAKADCCINPMNGYCAEPDSSNNCELPYILAPIIVSCAEMDSIDNSYCPNLPVSNASTQPTSAPTNTTTSYGPYKLLEGIPGFFDAGETVSFPDYIMAIYKFGLWTIGLCAMIMIMIGGYMYLTSAGNTASTGKAKEVITDAIIGLILALISFLLLYIINPDLIRLNF